MSVSWSGTGQYLPGPLAAGHPPRRAMSRVSPTARFGIALLLLGLAACDLPREIAERRLTARPDGNPVSLLSPADGSNPAAVSGPAREVLGQVTSAPRLERVARALPVVPGDRQVQVELRDIAAERVAREVLIDILGLPTTVDPGLSGNITLTTGGRIPAAELPRLLDEALAPLGWGLTTSAGRVRVGRLSELAAAGGASVELRVIPLRHLRAEELLPAIQANIPSGTRVTADPAGRGLVVEGPPAAVGAVEELARIFDADLLAGRSFGVYPLSAASPSQVVRELEQIFSGVRGLRFVAIDRLNAVLAVADTPDGLRRLRQTIGQLDAAPQAVAGVQVYPLRYRRAQEVAELLGRLFGAPTGAPPSRSSAVGEMGSLRVGPSEGAGVIGARPPSENTPLAQNAAHAAAAEGGVALTPAQLAAELGLSGPVRIQADPGRNALVVLASPTDFRLIEQAIRRLDVRQRQIFIEAAIAEVALTEGLQFGLEYAIRSGDSRFLQSGASGAAGLFTPSTPGGLLGGFASAGGGFAYLLSSSNIALALQALSRMTDVQVISAPRILVLDNELATLQVGDQVPILTRQSQSVDSSNAPQVNSVDLRDTGVILSVRARVGAGGNISLDVFQEVSDAVETASSTLNSPTIRMRRLQSSINVQSGETVALGGLMRDRNERSRRGIPFLSDLDLLGPLFGVRGAGTERTELLVMLTPRVIDDTGEASALAEELRAKLGSLAPELARGLERPSPTQRFTPPPRRTGPERLLRQP